MSLDCPVAFRPSSTESVRHAHGPDPFQRRETYALLIQGASRASLCERGASLLDYII